MAVLVILNCPELYLQPNYKPKSFHGVSMTASETPSTVEFNYIAGSGFES